MYWRVAFLPQFDSYLYFLRCILRDRDLDRYSDHFIHFFSVLDREEHIFPTDPLPKINVN